MSGDDRKGRFDCRRSGFAIPLRVSVQDLNLEMLTRSQMSGLFHNVELFLF